MIWRGSICPWPRRRKRGLTAKTPKRQERQNRTTDCTDATDEMQLEFIRVIRAIRGRMNLSSPWRLGGQFAIVTEQYGVLYVAQKHFRLQMASRF